MYAMLVNYLVAFLVLVGGIYCVISIPFSFKYFWEIVKDIQLIIENREIIFADTYWKHYWRETVLRDLEKLFLVLPGFLLNILVLITYTYGK